MQTLQIIHSYFRWIIVILYLTLLITWLIYTKQDKQNRNCLKKISLFLLASVHTNLLIGLTLNFLKIKTYLQNQGANFGTIMKDPSLRKPWIEHGTGMIIAVILITIAHINLKRGKSKKSLILFLIALFLLLYLIPTWRFIA